jgi:hypothetical protein
VVKAGDRRPEEVKEGWKNVVKTGDRVRGGSGSRG